MLFRSIHYTKGSFEFYSTMMRMEEQLYGKGFVRSHKSFLVNLRWIRAVDSNKVTLDNEESLPVGKKYYADNLKKLAKENNNPDFLDNAIDCAQKSVKLSPVDGKLHNNLGKIYWQMGNLDNAEYHLMLAVKYAAYRLGMFLDTGWFYFQQERMEDAKLILLKGLKLEEAAITSANSEEDQEMIKAQLLQMHLILGQIYFNEDEPELSDYHMQEVKKLDIKHPVVKQYFGD